MISPHLRPPSLHASPLPHLFPDLLERGWPALLRLLRLHQPQHTIQHRPILGGQGNKQVSQDSWRERLPHHMGRRLRVKHGDKPVPHLSGLQSSSHSPEKPEARGKARTPRQVLEAEAMLQTLNTFVVYRDRVLDRKMLAARAAHRASRTAASLQQASLTAGNTERREPTTQDPPLPPATLTPPPPTGAGVGSSEGKKHTDTVLARALKLLLAKSCNDTRDWTIATGEGEAGGGAEDIMEVLADSERMAAFQDSGAFDTPVIGAKVGQPGLLATMSAISQQRPYRLRMVGGQLLVDVMVVTPDVDPVGATVLDDTPLIKALAKYLKALGELPRQLQPAGVAHDTGRVKKRLVVADKTAHGVGGGGGEQGSLHAGAAIDQTALAFHKSRITSLQRKLLQQLLGVGPGALA